MKPYPSIAQSWGIFGIAIAAMLIFVPLNTAVSEATNAEIGMFVYYLLSMSVPLLFAYFQRKNKTHRSAFEFKAGSPLIYLLIIPTVLSIQIGFTIPISNLIPLPEFMKQLFLELSGYTGLFGFLTIVIAAPIIEEMIFRGIILDGFLRRYSPLKSILFSSFLFGIVHLNPWQFISAMLIGTFSGWVYFRTRNLLYSIFIHFINNLLPFIAMKFYSPEVLIDMDLEDALGSSTYASAVTLLSILLSVSLILLLKKRLKGIVWSENREA